jgi:enoyl-CoA hydratase/carnithine racemase
MLNMKRRNIAILTLNRPKALNALRPDLMHELQVAFEDFRADRDFWVGIITGSGQKAFCVGVDIKTWLPSVKEATTKT